MHNDETQARWAIHVAKQPRVNHLVHGQGQHGLEGFCAATHLSVAAKVLSHHHLEHLHTCTSAVQALGFMRSILHLTRIDKHTQPTLRLRQIFEIIAAKKNHRLESDGRRAMAKLAMEPKATGKRSRSLPESVL